MQAWPCASRRGCAVSEQPPLYIGRRIWLALILLVLSAVMFWRYRLEPVDAALLQFDGMTMGTTWQVQVPRQAAEDPEALHSAIQTRLDTLDHDIFSTWESRSELSLFNQAQAPVSQRISAEMAEVTAMARQVYRQSEGAFDPTIGPLVDLWGFGPAFSNEDIPPEEALAAALDRLGFDAIELDTTDPDAPLLRRRVERQLDYSAIAKGYAVDEIAGLLETRSVSDFLVEIGGELVASGQRPDGREWRIGIETPRSGRRELFRAIGNAGERLAIAASGDYRNHFELEGRRYSHEIDPLTGWPVSHSLVSVTVLHESAAMADAYATAFMIMGPERSRALATGLALPVYLIIRADATYDTWYTPAFEPYLRELNPAPGNPTATAVQDPQ